MNYIVLLPDYQMVRLDSKEATQGYIKEYYGYDLHSHEAERDLNEGEMTAKNVEDMCTVIGATDDACKIYSWESIEEALENSILEKEEKERIYNFLLDFPVEKPIKCPGDVSDLLTEAEETYQTELIGQRI